MHVLLLLCFSQVLFLLNIYNTTLKQNCLDSAIPDDALWKSTDMSKDCNPFGMISWNSLKTCGSFYFNWEIKADILFKNRHKNAEFNSNTEEDESLWVPGHPGQHSVFQDGQDYTGRPWLTNKENAWQTSYRNILPYLSHEDIASQRDAFELLL